MDYHLKYLKYKQKYVELKTKSYGDNTDNIDFFFNFNTSKKKIIQKYQYFLNLKLIKPPFKLIGKPSSNGFVNAINFKNIKDDNIFKTVLKTTVKKSSDNNYYEYVVGKCINKFKRYYPNFIYTFNYLILNETLKQKLQNSKEYNDINYMIANSNIINLNRKDLQNNINIGNGCKNNNRSSVLIEFIPNGLSLDELLKDSIFKNRLAYFNIEIYNILFQLYFCLSGLKEVYTHYDLHLDNVMFIKVPNNEKMQIDYNINGKKYSIYTSFIPVILDYGRSFIDCLKIDNILNSRIFAEIVCNNPNCNLYKHPKCRAIEVGLVIEKNDNDIFSKQEDFYNINLRNKNESIDLRYLHNLMTQIPNETSIKKIYNEYFNKEKDWINKDIYGKVKTDEKGTPIIAYGVKENLSNIDQTKNISNTTDCLRWLISLYSKIYYINLESKIYGVMKIHHNVNDKIKWTFEKK